MKPVREMIRIRKGENGTPVEDSWTEEVRGIVVAPGLAVTPGQSSLKGYHVTHIPTGCFVNGSWRRLQKECVEVAHRLAALPVDWPTVTREQRRALRRRIDDAADGVVREAEGEEDG